MERCLFRFGPFQLDLRVLELSRNGIKLKVPDQSLQILAMLLAHPGEVVTREELRQKLWPNGTIVEFDHSINAAMKRLRQALEDSPEEPTFVETLPRRGYRFLAPVEWVDSAEAVLSGTAPAPGSGEFIGQTFSHYRVSRKLGEGAMGVVYQAEDTKLGRSVALKFLPEELSDDPKALERFEREARAASALNHPNICTLHAVEDHQGVPFIAMEYVAGQSLDQMIGSGALPVEDVLAYAIQITDALGKAHSAGIIHRDLKPANVMVTEEGSVKLLDFGLAKVRAVQPAADSTPPTIQAPVTGESTTVGTPSYMAPEQLQGGQADARTDIFALGAVIYEMATGRQAFAGGTFAMVSVAILNRGHTPASRVNPGVPAELDRVINKALEKDPDARYQTATELAADLKRLKRDREMATIPARRHPIRPLRAAAVLAVIAVGLAMWLRWTDAPATRPAVQSIQSLAVLPLANLSHDPEQEYFADGMTDELITALAKISALRVISRTSVMQYKGTKKPIAQIARELNVDGVLEGTVTRDQGRVRITAQLIRASPERHLWAERYEGSLSEVLTIQDAVAKAVAHEIQVKVTPREQSLLATPRAVDPAAYDAYLKGRYLWEQMGEENLEKSREYFEQAIDKNPGYAPAWAGLADTYDYLARWGVLSSQNALPRARAAAEKALELDNSLAGPLVTLASVKMNYEWDWAGAERLCKRAIELSPNYGQAHHMYATYLAEIGRAREAVAEARRANEVEPLSPNFPANVAWKLYLARQYDDAELECRKLMVGSYLLASVYLQTGRRREAVAELQKAAAESNRSVIELMYLAHALGVSGARAEGRKVLEEMQRLSQRRYVPPEYIAIVYEGLGERDRALRWFEKAFEEHSMNGWMLPDPRLDRIRTEPRFKNIMRRMGLPQ